METFLIVVVVLLIVIVMLLMVLGYLVIRYSTRPGRINQTITEAVNSAIEKSAIREHIGRIEAYVRDVRSDYRKLDEMLRTPKERADIGEIMLENILKDQLPPDMFGIRKRLKNGKIPDAYIISTSGIICIDAKFALENYRRYCENEDEKEKKKSLQDFFKNLRTHLQKIAEDYITPNDGTVDFAFAYIPSEAVYYFMITESYELLQEFARKGVQVVSPLTLAHKVAIIRAGIHAKRLSEQAERVHQEIIRLKKAFEDYDAKWNTYMGHFRNAYKQIEGDLDKMYSRLRKEFERIETNIESISE